MLRLVSILLVLGLAGGCGDQSSKDTDAGSGSVDTTLAFWPPEAGRGTTFDARVTAPNSVLSYDGASLSFPDGVTVNSFTVLDGWTATANITVAGDAPLGVRDATVVTGNAGTLSIPEALTIVDDSFTIEPARALIGESKQVEFLGQNTEWMSGNTWAYFGDSIEVTNVEVLSETYALADVTVGADAVPGLRDVAMEVGPDVTTLYGGFQVDRVAISAVFDPKEAQQGTTVDFTIEGAGTHFEADSELEFWQGGDQKGDILVDWINVLDNEHMYGQMTVSNAAETGWRDVLVRSEDEGVYITDAFEVKDGDLDLTNVGISLWFNIVRGIDNATGGMYEQVSGGAIFYIPLDPPCGASPPPADGPQPYDVNGVFPNPPPVEEPDCPSPATVGAGEHVWFESPCNVVTFDRQVDPASGMIYYSAPLTLDDYCFDQLYDLHTEGEEGGIGEYVVPSAQPTVPADFEILTPQLWGNYTQNRSEDFHYTWTPAQTYPDAIFVTGISGTLVETGEGGFAGSVPWDDGDHTYVPAELTQLEAGNVSFYAESYIEGPTFGFPFSTIQSNYSTSYLYVGAAMVLE